MQTKSMYIIIAKGSRSYFGPQWTTLIHILPSCLARRLGLLWVTGSGHAKTQANFISKSKQETLHVSRREALSLLVGAAS